MTEHRFKDLLKKSTVETSDGFMDKLMQKVEAEAENQSTIIVFRGLKSILVTGFILIAIGSILLKFGLPDITYFGKEIDVAKFPVMALISLFILLSIERYLHLRKGTPGS